MKVKFQTEELKKRLAQLSAVVARKAAQPVYGFMRLCTGEPDLAGKRPVFAIGLDIDASLTLQFAAAEADGDVDVLLPFSKLTEIVGNVTLAESSIDVVDETKATFKSGRYSAILHPFPLTNWPTIPERPESVKGTISLAAFKELLGNVKSAVPESEGKHVVPVAMVEAKSDVPATDGVAAVAGTLKSVATDGVRLAISTMAANIGEFTLIIPIRGLELVEKLDGGEQLTILEGESGFQFETTSETLTVSRSHGTFPDYSRVLPSSFKTEIVIDKIALLAAIKRVKPLGNSEKPVIDFSVSENDKELLLSTSSAADGTDGMSFENSASDAADATVTGPAAQFALDGNKLLPFVERAYGSKTGFITIRVKASNCAVDFYANGGLYRWLQMPTVG